MVVQEQAARYENVRLHAAYMPHMFGTHHTKMIVLFRHDDTAQVVIHTANMIVRDWTNMTQGIWLSPLLPLLPESQHARDPLGPGERFKRDLISYIQAYSEGARHGRGICGALAKELLRYDFSAVRARLIASVPGTHPTSAGPGGETLWGWAGLRQALSEVEIRPASDGGKAEIVAQVSSIATLGATDAWLRGTLFAAMETGKEVAASGADNGPTDSVRGGSGTLTLSKAKTATASRRPRPSFKVVFPTAPEIRRSLDGYESGASIHTKTQSPQQQRQLDYLRPMLCRWANDMDGRSPGRQLVDGSAGHAKETKRWLRDGGRNRAAPHIKTYIRYYYPSSFPSDGPTIDWALLTSANISKQAWGEAANGNGETMRIASWEVGVLVWPALLAGDAGAGPTTTRMIPVFKTDEPTDYDRGGKGKAAGASDLTTIGLRVPYSLPLEPYAPGEQPWVATAVHTIPDWMGRVWSE